MVEITGAERERLLALEEDTFADLKAVEVTPKKLTNVISAFANTAGGDLYIGIGEMDFMGTKIRRWKGFRDQESANGHLQCLEELFPLGAEYSYEFLRAPGSPGLVLHVTVQRTPQIARTLDKKVYVRRGAQNLEVRSEEALARLRLDKGIESFETQTVDVDLDIVAESDTLQEFVKLVVPTMTPTKFLKKQRLIKNGKPVVAAVLLFADEPQAVLPKRSGVKLYRYKTSGTGSRETLVNTPRPIEGPVYSLIKAAVRETAAILEGIQKLGPSGLEFVKYPAETLHEIVTNAILHRDYSIAADVQIRVFDNRVEVESPGLLPGHVTIQNILDEQFARNGILVRLINKFPEPPNKDVGEGLNTAFKAMQKLRLKPPGIEETESSVLVQIRHEPLASPEESVMDYLQNHEVITNRIARELTGITSENSMKEVFYRLNKSGLIERVPGKTGAAAAWQKTPKKAPAPAE
ncbi:MAG TPA: ATP-binding protein [Candidatus Polarisedimenticolaceae bacterium]|nr:ATP-binding protein [Candidatus Polarisedimenticolaceae bacterium]